MSRLSLVMLGFCCMAVLSACDLGTQNNPPVADAGVDAEPVIPPPNADPLLGCAGACHGDETSIAPPKDTTGGVETTLRSVGAHRDHLNPAPTWHRKILCEDCHQVPAAAGDPGHIDTPVPAELTFSALAAQGGPIEWNGETCANAYCHGSTLPGGALTQPNWTTVDNTQDACGNCHGYPPPAPHPANTDCGTCHPTVQPGTTSFLDPASHIDGKLDTTGDVQGCDSCHGGGGVAAPPTDLDGNTAITYPGVGAHRAHIGPSDWHAELNCAQCHTVPVNVADPGHIDGDNQAELTFDGISPLATYDAATATCSNLYCHGNGRTSNGTMVWTADVNVGCGSCHSINGDGMSGRHQKHLEEGMDCNECHEKVVDAARQFIGPQYHVNGVHEVNMPNGTFDPVTRNCSNVGCHNNKKW